MYGGILYWFVYSFLYFLLLKNDEYRNLAIGFLAVLVLAAWQFLRPPYYSKKCREKERLK